MRLLATAATRRLARWQDPATGGFEASDRETLMRQAAEMGLSPEVADKILAGVIEAFQNRPTPVPLAAEARATSRRRRWPRGLPIWLLAITALLLAIQVGVVVLWLRLFV